MSPCHGESTVRWENLQPKTPSTPPASGRAAFFLILEACKRQRPGRDEVVLPAYTCPVLAYAARAAGLRVRLVLGERGFEVARAGVEPVVVIRAHTAALLRLVRGEDDADRLFFERQLVMEGDTEFALLLKNTLDAIGPLWAGGRP